MAKIKFANGATVNFNGNPTPQDIEEVAKKLGVGDQKEQDLAGNQFQQEEPITTAGDKGGFLTKARDFTAGIIGGGKLAQGLGMGLASKGVQQDISGGTQGLSEQQDKTIAAMKKARAEGKDTTKLAAQLKSLQGGFRQQGDVATDFEQALPTSKEVVGSAIRLGTTAAGGTLAKGAAQLTGASKAVGIGQGIMRGAGAGAISGGLGGAAYGAGMGLEQNKDALGVAKSAGIYGAGGAAAGGLIGGVAGGITGGINKMRSPETLIQKATPRTSDLTPKQYQKLLDSGNIKPKTSFQPEQVILKPEQQATVRRFSHLMDNDPTRSSLNITKQIDTFDDEVGTFLKDKNYHFDTEVLRNRIKDSLADIDDLMISSDRIAKGKQQLVDKFVDSLDKNDLHTLWSARKNYDQLIEKSFSGAPNVQKEIKIALRNAVQDFLADSTPSSTYKDYMRDMSQLFKLRDLVDLKAISGRRAHSIGDWMKNNPLKTKAAETALGFGLLGGGGYWLGHSRSDSG